MSRHKSRQDLSHKSPFDDPLFLGGGRPTTAGQLSGWLQEHVPGFSGVLMGDLAAVKPKLRPGLSYLVNIDSTGGRGTHWTALRLSDCAARLALYVDPAGFPPPMAITHHLRDNGYETLFSDVRNQREANDASCGQRACIALRDLAAAPCDLSAFGEHADARST